MKDKTIYDKIFEGPCDVCGKTIKKDCYGQGKCPYCGWRNCYLNDENPDRVLYPNLVPLNKAKILYTQGKKIEPDLDDFIGALHAYSEVQFVYNNICYAVELIGFETGNIQIQLYNPKTGEDFIFKNDDDFKNNAKVEGKLLKDIWDNTTDRYWLQ